jgi:hypothetical protein
MWSPGVHVITLGTYTLRWFWENGYKTRPRVRCWNYYSSAALRGPECVFRTVLHELAHVLQTEAGARAYRKMHEEVFYTSLRALIREIPYKTPYLTLNTDLPERPDRIHETIQDAKAQLAAMLS